MHAVPAGHPTTERSTEGSSNHNRQSAHACYGWRCTAAVPTPLPWLCAALPVTALLPAHRIRTSSCGEVLASKSYGYGDYVFVVDTNPATVSVCLGGGGLCAYGVWVGRVSALFSKVGTVCNSGCLGVSV
jgi:hypothetical protein